MDGMLGETKPYNEYYHQMLKESLEYQDFVGEILCKHGIPLTFYTSEKYQKTKGENVQGFEIKLDKIFIETKNLYIETSEKSNPSMDRYTPSGIYRKDNGWLYIIGNYSIIFIFQTTLLQGLHKSGTYTEKVKPTSTGFLLPQISAHKYAAKIIRIPGEAV
jgi:hypothetical protein